MIQKKDLSFNANHRGRTKKRDELHRPRDNLRAQQGNTSLFLRDMEHLIIDTAVSTTEFPMESLYGSVFGRKGGEGEVTGSNFEEQADFFQQRGPSVLSMMFVLRRSWGQSREKKRPWVMLRAMLHHQTPVFSTHTPELR